VKQNKVKRALKAGKISIGSAVTRLRAPEVCRIFAVAGFEFVFIDTEHAVFGIETVAEMIAQCRNADTVPIVRVTGSEYHLIARMLDAGAQGVVVPRISSRQEVEDIVSWTRYPPLGTRGVGMTTAQTDYQSMSATEFIHGIHQETLVIIQIERKIALDNLDDLISVPGVDVATAGWMDLSVDLGVPGQIDHPLMVAGLQTIIDSCTKHRIAAGIIHPNLEVVKYWAERGMRWICYSTDGAMLLERAETAAREARDACTDA
jgi:2-dehydro-3-deoxyglucarate aldolase/4-hydroxy-2-oxoheptanedioate aldolase